MRWEGLGKLSRLTAAPRGPPAADGALPSAGRLGSSRSRGSAASCARGARRHRLGPLRRQDDRRFRTTVQASAERESVSGLHRCHNDCEAVLFELNLRAGVLSAEIQRHEVYEGRMADVSLSNGTALWTCRHLLRPDAAVVPLGGHRHGRGAGVERQAAHARVGGVLQGRPLQRQHRVHG